MARLGALVAADARNLVRDPFLVLITVLPLGVALLVRAVYPHALALLEPWVDLSQYRELIVAFLMVLPPQTFGWVVGLLMLDERDEGVLAAIAVTPLRMSGFLTWRLAVPVGVSLVLSAAVLPLGGLLPLSPVVAWVAAVVAGLEAPLIALYLVAFASNKLEGLAYGKLGNLAMLGAFGAVLAPAAWQPLFAWLPPYWIARLLVLRDAGTFPLLVLGALAVHGAWFAVLLWRVRKRPY